MPVPGTKPKEDGEKRHRVRPTHEWIEVQDVPNPNPPSLPKGRWNAGAKRWWSVIAKMPHTVLWDDEDWDFATETLKLQHDFWAGKSTLAGELRLRRQRMGATWDARRDLRIRYVQALPEEEAKGIAEFEDYKKRLGAR